MELTYGRIKELCEQRSIRLSQLAAAIGIRSSVFTELKMGRTKQLSAQTLRRIAEYFEVSVDSLMETSTPDVDVVRDELYRKRRLLFDMSAKASNEELDTILKVVGALIAD